MQRTFSVREYFSVIARRKWHLITPLIIVVSVSAVFTLMLPKIYLSRATILVKSRSASSIKGIFQPQSLNTKRLSAMKKVIKSRGKIEELIKELGLEQNIDGPEAYENLVRTISKGILILIRGSVIKVSFRGDDPHTVMRVANALAGYFVNQDVNLMVGSRGSHAVPVLQELADYYERRVNAARGVMTKFELEHKGNMLSSLDANFNKIEKAQLKLAETEVTIREETEKKRILEKQLAGDKEKLPDFEFVRKKLTPDEKQINRLYAERDSLLAKYTPRHPEIIRIKSKIDALRQNILIYYRKEGVDPYVEEAVNMQQISLSPQYLKLRKILDETTLRISELQKKKEGVVNHIQKLNERVSMAPGIKQEFAALQRDLNVNNKIYKSLMTKVEKAQLAKEIDAMQQSNRFSILNPAQLPMNPIAPRVGRNIIIATMVGILIGISFALWAELSDHSLRDLADSKEFLSIPILSTIPTVSTEEEISRKRRINMLITVTGTFYSLFFMMLIARELLLMYAPKLLYLQTYKEWFYQLSEILN
jgi:polysaccharide chain length determinant protein (PEP-CTERM system associated)